MLNHPVPAVVKSGATAAPGGVSGRKRAGGPPSHAPGLEYAPYIPSPLASPAAPVLLEQRQQRRVPPPIPPRSRAFYRLKDKDFPVDILELPRKNDRVLGLYWEPRGSRFCIMHYDGEGPGKSRPDVSFFEMEDMKGGVKTIKPLGSLKGKPCSRVFWSPKGKNLVLAGMGSLNGILEFFNVDEFVTMNTG